MKFGKFEISEFTIGFVLIVLLILVVMKFSTDLEIEKEKTKQMQYQVEYTIIQNGGNNENSKSRN